MRVRFQHRTRYGYEIPAALGPHLIRLRPASHARAGILSYSLHTAPKGDVHWQQDPHGNYLARLTYPADTKVRFLEVTVDATVEIRPVNPFDFFVDDRCKLIPFDYPDGLAIELAPFRTPPKVGPRLAAFLKDVPSSGHATDMFGAVVQRVCSTVKYILRSEPGIWSSEQTLEYGRGSCRDSAQLLVDVFRASGLAARFVSGYLIQLTDEGNLPDEQKGVSKDVIDLHAWCEVYLPGAGWIGVDGTSGLFCNEGHIPLAATVESALAAAIDGTSDVAATSFDFSMQIERLGHEFRPRVPYADETWAAVQAAGAAADALLESSGLRLTMGGEPTFTSRRHAREPEWNGDALGPTKRVAGRQLGARLLTALGQGGLLFERQGKHYPGESLPRWAIEMVWRSDGEPVWKDPQWLDIGAPQSEVTAADPAPDATLAHRASQLLARRLGVGVDPYPAYEDPWIFIAREALLPDDADALAVDLSSSEERRTLARVLGRGLGSVVGYALPLGWDELDRGWVSAPWTFRRQRLFLLPGDSPMGLRLPLDRLGGVAPELWQRDVTALDLGSEPLPVLQRAADRSPPLVVPPAHGEEHLRTTLCIEPRDGALWIFLPPVPSAESYLALIEVVEDVARQLCHRVRIEGYPPPSDPRLRRCQVTPDPGVVEVNLPPTATFAEYSAMIETVAGCAVSAGLTTEKFQLDGREVGSGGGHHLTLGGMTTAQSPWLLRPHLLASFLRFTQNHPSLSFLFTGMFVGPTSQAPRIDEARHDALGELELALTHLEGATETPPPWFVDRALRNLLADASGNTHRTEVCIDKLYDPGTLSGRQGLVELRAFEMPPHERMAVAQMLLVRSIVAAFAAEPYRRPLIRWGGELHDRFMLPHFLWADFVSVREDLAIRGVDLPLLAYSAFLEHRMPVLGTVTVEDVTLELRQALEPWPVLAEQTSPTGTSRYVDSSLERLQVKVDGVIEGRHQVLVNGMDLPMRPTGRAAERVAGVRFRAWQVPNCLHPQIGVHHPLRFDVIDTWAQRSLGACTHHVCHPGGRGFDEPPLTAFEAAARRAQRFTTIGHLSWPVTPRPTTVDPERPFCLDLRRYD